MLGAVLGVAANVGLDDVGAVEEGHDAVGADPDLVPGVGGDDGEGGDVELELFRLGELACTHNHALALGFRTRRGEGGKGSLEMAVPMQIPRERSLSRATEVARLARERRT